MKLIIACPIYKRDWILPYWIKAILKQSLHISNIGFVFEVDPKDTSTVESLKVWKKIDKNIPLFDIVERTDIPHFEHHNNGRQWTLSKYHNMINMRNSILSRVRQYQPDYYFSLDSDILIENPNTLELLIAHINEGADAVSPMMYMTPIGKDFPSVMSWVEKPGEKATRKKDYPLGSYFQSDIIMAAKMMSKKTYMSVDYEFHQQGEDLGWSKNAALNNLKLFNASYIYAPHIMSPIHLNEYFKNGDLRSTEKIDNLAKV
jgi:hypothetical protein